MKSEEIKELFKQFESIVCEYNKVECWSARELYPLLGYSQWRNFLSITEKAKDACKNAGENIAYHFADVSKMVILGSGAEREVDNISDPLCLLSGSTKWRFSKARNCLCSKLLCNTNAPCRISRATFNRI